MQFTPDAASFHGGIVTALDVSPAGVLLNTTVSASPVLEFHNFSLRCDKSDHKVSFQSPWNWSLLQGKRIAIITTNSFLRYQLIAGISGLIPPVSGGIDVGGVIGWPVGGQGGLDSKLRVSHALSFLSSIYSDCLEKSRVSVDEFWELLAGMEVHHSLCIKELGRSQKQFFYLALSMLFSFDCYLIPKTRFLMSKLAKPLRELLLSQVVGKMLITTSSNAQFQREFCTDGLVLDQGAIVFSGPLQECREWYSSHVSSKATDDDNELDSTDDDQPQASSDDAEDQQSLDDDLW